LIKISIDNCENFRSNECQKFFKTELKNLGCKNENSYIIENVQKMIDNVASIFTTSCAVDENEKSCPISALIMDYNKELIRLREFNDKYEDTLKENCKSKTCIDMYLKHVLKNQKIIF